MCANRCSHSTTRHPWDPAGACEQVRLSCLLVVLGHVRHARSVPGARQEWTQACLCHRVAVLEPGRRVNGSAPFTVCWCADETGMNMRAHSTIIWWLWDMAGMNRRGGGTTKL